MHAYVCDESLVTASSIYTALLVARVLLLLPYAVMVNSAHLVQVNIKQFLNICLYVTSLLHNEYTSIYALRLISDESLVTVSSTYTALLVARGGGIFYHCYCRTRV